VHRQSAITGIGHTEYSRASGRTERQLALQAGRAALADAQVEPHEVDGIVRYSTDSTSPAHFARSFGASQIRYYAEVPFGGAACGAVITNAAAAISAGQASVVLVYRSLNERSGVRYGRAERHFGGDSTDPVAAGDQTPAGAFSAPYGLLSPGQVMALWARRYMHVNGLTEAELAAALGTVAVQQRAYANTNPNAMMRDRPLTMADYLSGRMIATPLRLFDYCLESDGAAAVVLVSADRARATRDDAAYVLAGGQALRRHAEPLTVYQRDLLHTAPPAAIARLYDDARLSPADIDVAMLYDATSVEVLLGLEVYGFAESGQGWRYLLENGISLGSPRPVNTHGGHLSEAYIHGMNHVLEAVRQIRGTSASQRPGARNVLVGVHGASSVILGRSA
jgi:acetyl-CoA acetyltransferase